MSYSGRYRLSSEEIANERFDGEFVLLNLQTGIYFAVGGAGSVLLDGVLDGYDVGEMLAAMDDARAAEAQAFMEAVMQKNLLAPDPEPALPLPAEWHSRIAEVREPFTLESFDDLAELIRADPIHDVKEDKGWPFLRQQ